MLSMSLFESANHAAFVLKVYHEALVADKQKAQVIPIRERIWRTTTSEEQFIPKLSKCLVLLP